MGIQDGISVIVVVTAITVTVVEGGRHPVRERAVLARVRIRGDTVVVEIVVLKPVVAAIPVLVYASCGDLGTPDAVVRLVEVAVVIVVIVLAGVLAAVPVLAARGLLPLLPGELLLRGLCALLLGGVRALGRRKARSGPRGIVSFPGGLGELPSRMAERLGDRLRLSSPISSVAADPSGGFRLEGATDRFDGVVVAAAAPAAPRPPPPPGFPRPPPPPQSALPPALPRPRARAAPPSPPPPAAPLLPPSWAR